MTASEPRPRNISVAFWCWVAAAIMLIMLGLLLLLSRGSVPVFFRAAGGVWIASGVGLSFLSGRARRGDERFRRAAVALALSLSALLAMFTLLSRGLIWLLVMILVLAGAILMMRPSVQEWYQTEDTQDPNA